MDDMEASIVAIKSKLKEFVKDKNKVSLAVKLGINKNYFTDLAKKKTFNITELALFSKEFDYDFFQHVKVNVSTTNKSESLTKKAKIFVTIEVDNENDERKILETVLDKNSVKKLIG